MWCMSDDHLHPSNIFATKSIPLFTSTYNVETVCISCTNTFSLSHAGNEHTVVLSRAGEVFTAGYNDNGQCGQGTTQRVGVLTRVPVLVGNRAVQVTQRLNEPVAQRSLGHAPRREAFRAQVVARTVTIHLSHRKLYAAVKAPPRLSNGGLLTTSMVQNSTLLATTGALGNLLTCSRPLHNFSSLAQQL